MKTSTSVIKFCILLYSCIGIISLSACGEADNEYSDEGYISFDQHCYSNEGIYHQSKSFVYYMDAESGKDSII